MDSGYTALLWHWDLFLSVTHVHVVHDRKIGIKVSSGNSKPLRSCIEKNAAYCAKKGREFLTQIKGNRVYAMAAWARQSSSVDCMLSRPPSPEKAWGVASWSPLRPERRPTSPQWPPVAAVSQAAGLSPSLPMPAVLGHVPESACSSSVYLSSRVARHQLPEEWICGRWTLLKSCWCQMPLFCLSSWLIVWLIADYR